MKTLLLFTFLAISLSFTQGGDILKIKEHFGVCWRNPKQDVTYLDTWFEPLQAKAFILMTPVIPTQSHLLKSKAKIESNPMLKSKDAEIRKDRTAKGWRYFPQSYDQLPFGVQNQIHLKWLPMYSKFMHEMSSNVNLEILYTNDKASKLTADLIKKFAVEEKHGKVTRFGELTQWKEPEVNHESNDKVKAFENTPAFQKVIAKVKKYYNFTDLSLDDLITIWDACRYETVTYNGWEDNKAFYVSPWCDAFDEESAKQLEVRENKLYFDGPLNADDHNKAREIFRFVRDAMAPGGYNTLYVGIISPKQYVIVLRMLGRMKELLDDGRYHRLAENLDPKVKPVGTKQYGRLLSTITLTKKPTADKPKSAWSIYVNGGMVITRFEMNDLYSEKYYY